MVKSVEYMTPAVQENISTAHFVLVRAKQTMPDIGNSYLLENTI